HFVVDVRDDVSGRIAHLNRDVDAALFHGDAEAFARFERQPILMIVAMRELPLDGATVFQLRDLRWLPRRKRPDRRRKVREHRNSEQASRHRESRAVFGSYRRSISTAYVPVVVSCPIRSIPASSNE